MTESIDFKWIKSHYFSDENKFISVKKGEVLLDYNQKNKRLYLVLSGKFLGFLKEVNLENYPIFEASKNKFIGVYSYLTKEHLIYSKVVAAEDSAVAYYDKSLPEHDPSELEKIMPFLMSVVVNELYQRQHFAKQMAKEKQQDVQKLLKAEKMATLGQMAAGLAHELNNSMGVIDSSMDNVESFITQFLEEKGSGDLFDFFRKGLTEGQLISSAEARKQRTEYKSALSSLGESQIKKLSKTGISILSIKSFIGKDSAKADQIINNWELGCTLHNMSIAAKHSNHVIKSVKQLGVAEHTWSKKVDINQTITESLVIVQNLTKRVNTITQLGELSPTDACPGELIQVWINLIKNAVESMIHANTKSPQLLISSKQLKAEQIEVSIMDNGPGIPKDIMSRVFEPSFTAKVNGLSFGLGLGLSIVQRIVTEHDGEINVTSCPGETIFSIKLPIIQ